MDNQDFAQGNNNILQFNHDNHAIPVDEGANIFAMVANVANKGAILFNPDHNHKFIIQHNNNEPILPQDLHIGRIDQHQNEAELEFHPRQS